MTPPLSVQSEAAVDQFLMRLGYTHDTELADVATDFERYHKALEAIAATTPDSRPDWVHWAEQARRALRVDVVPAGTVCPGGAITEELRGESSS